MKLQWINTTVCRYSSNFEYLSGNNCIVFYIELAEEDSDIGDDSHSDDDDDDDGNDRDEDDDSICRVVKTDSSTPSQGKKMIVHILTEFVVQNHSSIFCWSFCLNLVDSYCLGHPLKNVGLL